jgi:hypothetical protein
MGAGHGAVSVLNTEAVMDWTGGQIRRVKKVRQTEIC